MILDPPLRSGVLFWDLFCLMYNMPGIFKQYTITKPNAKMSHTFIQQVTHVQNTSTYIPQHAQNMSDAFPKHPNNMFEPSSQPMYTQLNNRSYCKGGDYDMINIPSVCVFFIGVWGKRVRLRTSPQTGNAESHGKQR